MEPTAKKIKNATDPKHADFNPTIVPTLEAELAQLIAWDSDKNVDPKKFGYQDFTSGDKVFTAMNRLREHADVIETMVDDQDWQLPKYREMLFLQ